MTAGEWDRCDDFDRLRRALIGRWPFRSVRPSPRKAVLLAVSHFRIARAPVDEQMMDVWERYADGSISRADLHAIYRQDGSPGAPIRAVELATFIPGYTPTERAAAVRLLREVFGNPFRPVAFDPSWRTSTAVELARQMYESRGFDRMPILADALEDAGCDDPQVLAHCRGDGPHVRGCWVVDLVLGKS